MDDQQTRDRTTTMTNGTVEQAKTMARTVGEQAVSAASQAMSAAGSVASSMTGDTAQDLARRAREQASAAGDTLYRQGAVAGEYLSRNVNEYPLTALLVAAAIGYGLAYLIHNR